MLRGLDGLKSDERNLHGQDCADRIHGGVRNVDAMGEATADHQHKHVQGNEVDEEHVAAPGRHLQSTKSNALTSSVRMIYISLTM